MPAARARAAVGVVGVGGVGPLCFIVSVTIVVAAARVISRLRVGATCLPTLMSGWSRKALEGRLPGLKAFVA